MKKIVLFVLCIITSLFFYGCSNNSIQFNRESKFSEVLNGLQFQPNEPKVKKSSGVMIYKDEQQPKNETSSSNFGPGDINFDLKMKF